MSAGRIDLCPDGWRIYSYRWLSAVAWRDPTAIPNCSGCGERFHDGQQVHEHYAQCRAMCDGCEQKEQVR